MVEVRPATSLVMAKPDFLLEILVIALNPPAHFGQIDQGMKMFLSTVDNQYFVGSAAPSGHSISSVSSAAV